MGKVTLYDLSHPFGDKVPLWPYFADVKIERMHYHAKSGVLSQIITTTMHCTTHADSPAHVFEGGMFTDEIPLDCYYGTGVAVSIPKKKWELITAEDLENARPKIEKGDMVMVNTGWHHYYSDSVQYFCYSPGMGREAGEWFVEKGIKCLGVDQQALDHPFHTTIGPHGPKVLASPLRGDICDEYERETGRKVIDDFPEWEPCHNLILRAGIMGYENVGGDLDKVTGTRCTFAGFPIRWMKGDGSIVRLVAIVDKGDQ